MFILQVHIYFSTSYLNNAGDSYFMYETVSSPRFFCMWTKEIGRCKNSLSLFSGSFPVHQQYIIQN